MAPFTAWLPPRPHQEFDFVLKIMGPSAAVLFKELMPITQFLTGRGFAVMAQRGMLSGDVTDCVLHLRIASRTFYSMGHGCDGLIDLDGHTQELPRIGIQPGSVLLWEPPGAHRPSPLIPAGVIVYALPLTELCAPYSEGLPSKGLAALAALLSLLGIPETPLRRLAPSLAAPRSFEAGLDFGLHAIEKRDIYSLPLPGGSHEQSRLMLTPERAILLGFAVSSCECRSACDADLIASPTQWTSKHLGIAGAMVSVLESDSHPGVQAYRGPQGQVMALLRGNDAAVASCFRDFKAPEVFIASDLSDTVRLLIAGHELIRSGRSDGVGVLLEDTLALRHQSLDIHTLVEMIGRRKSIDPNPAIHTRPQWTDATSQRERTVMADVGFVAWGAAQGVVRDAVALCQSFGLKVAGLYPSRIMPLSHEEIESFARSVSRIVLVEEGHTKGYWDRLRAGFSFEYTVLTPLVGKPLTAMDIFLREGLGAL
ncbi:PFOR_II domain-containing protein [Nitrospira tepida]|uniref:PFOR_II domain-containing protein n=1 Tax=Nitrospira tepida TaxID=2973512 RepID=A0AA86T8L9_9BACT|nr:hypothetical protein [Nitrospira tepida]CAI4029858.1 PFOR_II domain-containing protein [Nitrospira tepida]